MEQEQAQYLTVRQFADRAGVSTQRVYKALQSGLQQYCKLEGNKKYISSEGLRLFQKSDCQPIANELATDTKRVDNQSEKQSQEQAAVSSAAVVAEALQATIDALTEQLAVKDEQISAKDRQISELTTALTTAQDALMVAQRTQQSLTDALTASQALHAGTIQALRDAQQTPQEQPQDAPVVDAPSDEETPEKQETAPVEQEQKKPRNFWARIFGKDR